MNTYLNFNIFLLALCYFTKTLHCYFCTCAIKNYEKHSKENIILIKKYQPISMGLSRDFSGKRPYDFD